MYACSELGLGHASRTMALGKRLEQNGHELFFFSGGKAYSVLNEVFNNVYFATPTAWYENSSGILTSASLINTLFPLPYFDGENGKLQIKSSNAMEVIRRYYDLRRNIHEIQPDMLIADGDINALRLAHRWKIPAVYITNLIRPSYGFSALLSPGERFTERYVKDCAKIIIPDNPPPDTICDYNIGNLQHVGVSDKTEYVGSFFDTTPTAGSDKYVFAPISGPFGTRSKLMQMMLPIFQELGVTGVISLGMPGEARKSVRIGNCDVHTWLSAEERRQCMQNASTVIFSGGHITCFEVVKYAKPSICIPTQAEQLANATKLSDMHCSITAKNKRQLRHAMQQIQTNHAAYKQNITRLNEASNQYDGLKRAAQIIEDLLS
ncbi:MAG: hypothetical protein NWF04_07805 [Candidatus Bathyarchaeota archaeon]|nr:hypothetical protein [Candidatus Bathyarchaeota archaeon]